jgi:hypothetical protein
VRGTQPASAGARLCRLSRTGTPPASFSLTVTAIGGLSAAISLLHTWILQSSKNRSEPSSDWLRLSQLHSTMSRNCLNSAASQHVSHADTQSISGPLGESDSTILLVVDSNELMAVEAGCTLDLLRLESALD